MIENVEKLLDYVSMGFSSFSSVLEVAISMTRFSGLLEGVGGAGSGLGHLLLSQTSHSSNSLPSH